MNAKLCPPGYIIDEGGFCDLEVTSDALGPQESKKGTFDCAKNERFTNISSPVENLRISPREANYRAVLTPAEVVPPVQSDSSGVRGA